MQEETVKNKMEQERLKRTFGKLFGSLLSLLAENGISIMTVNGMRHINKQNIEEMK